MLAAILFTLAGFSVALTIWQFWAAQQFPLHERSAPCADLPPLTILKPLKGVDPHTAECLESWCRQTYPAPVEILCGVAERGDPVCRVVEQLQTRYPAANLQLLTCEIALGSNPKVSTLAQLWPRAQHDLILISDADVKAPEDLLINFAVPMREPSAGLICAFYRLPPGPTLAMRLEAVAVNADFWSQVLQSRTLKPIDFALGAAMLTTRQNLEAIGGFRVLADYLADDYELGHRIAALGKKILISTTVVDCLSPVSGWRAIWAHQVRWARTIRACQPIPFFFSILANSTLWLLLWLIADSRAWVFVAVLAGLAWRASSASILQARLWQKAQFNGWWAVFLRDLAGVVVWAAAFGGNRLVWRDEEFILRPGGKLERRP